jgi:hypothetical protein
MNHDRNVKRQTNIQGQWMGKLLRNTLQAQIIAQGAVACCNMYGKDKRKISGKQSSPEQSRDGGARDGCHITRRALEPIDPCPRGVE